MGCCGGMMTLRANPSLAAAKFYFKEFYCLDCLTLEDVLWDNEGRRRGELLVQINDFSDFLYIRMSSIVSRPNFMFVVMVF